MTAQRLQVLVAKVHQPQRVKSYADVNAAIEEWEMNVQTFLKADGRDDLNEAVKLLSIEQIFPEELSKDIAKASSVLKDYHQVEKYIQEQVAVRRDVKNVSKGPVPLDLNMAAQQVLASLMTGDGQQSADQEQYEYQCGGCNDESEPEDKVAELFSLLQESKVAGAVAKLG